MKKNDWDQIQLDRFSSNIDRIFPIYISSQLLDCLYLQHVKSICCKIHSTFSLESFNL